MSLYNKHRPSDFKNLIQGSQIDQLRGALKHHAYLFFGPAGTGKTSAARLCMSKYVDPKDVSMCINGKHPDYVEVNCAVNNGVDDARNLVTDVVNTMPIKAEFKFIVLDETHMLTTASQNALLKTLEEPPKHVKFFLCTTEINKVLPTIRSRCQIVPFLKLNESSLYQILENICVEEKFNFDQDSLKLIAKYSSGSARQAINILEQCSESLHNTSLVAGILGTADENIFFELTSHLVNRDMRNSLILFDSMIESVNDPYVVVNHYGDYIAEQIVKRTASKEVPFTGNQLYVVAQAVIDILKDFKQLQNIKLISKQHLLKAISKMP